MADFHDTQTPLAEGDTAPQREARPHLTLVPGAEEEFDALADLFLGDDAVLEAGPERSDAPREIGSGAAPSRRAPDESSRPAAVRPPIEALVLGHLPVSASTWIRQYAALRVRELGGPVALVRRQGADALVEVIGDAAAPPEPAESAADALRLAAERVRAWLVRVDEPSEPELVAAAPDSVALLTGADEAAVVATYRAVKGLLGGRGTVLDDEGPELRVAIMGMAEPRAREAFERIARATETFLTRPIGYAGCSPRIEPAPASVLWRGAMPLSAAELVASLRDGSPASAPAAAPGASPRAVAPIAPAALRAEREDAASVEAGAARDDHIHPADEEQPLSRHLHLEATRLRCPDAPRVELALDDEGDLHLLSNCGCESLASLSQARAWAERHLELLRLADSRLRGLAPQAEGTHVLVRSAPKGRPLLDMPLRVHLLAPVEVQGRRGWFCTPLN